MYRFLLTPRWWGINLFAALAIPVCVFMGSWQLSRFEDRVDSHEQQEKQAGSKHASRPLARLLPVDKETSGEAATARGRYGDQFVVPDRALDGRKGYYVLTLLRTGQGKALPVVRGWLPGTADPAKAPAPPRGEITVTGDLQASETPGAPGVHAGDGLPKGQIGMVSTASLINVVSYPVYDAWITLPETGDGMKPVPYAAPQDSGLDLKAFQNLGYTGEWFVFAGFVVFMWFRLFRREVELAQDAELGITPPDPDASERNPAPAAPA